MAKSFPLNTVICLDVLGQPLMRGDFVLISASDHFDLGVVKKPGKTTMVEGAVVTKLIRRFGYDNRTIGDTMMVRVSHDDAVRMLTREKLSGSGRVCPAGLQLLTQVERQRAKETQGDGRGIRCGQ